MPDRLRTRDSGAVDRVIERAYVMAYSGTHPPVSRSGACATFAERLRPRENAVSTGFLTDRPDSFHSRITPTCEHRRKGPWIQACSGGVLWCSGLFGGLPFAERLQSRRRRLQIVCRAVSDAVGGTVRHLPLRRQWRPWGWDSGLNPSCSMRRSDSRSGRMARGPQC